MSIQPIQYHETQANICFDYLFIGLGAGNGLMLLSLLKHGVLHNKKVCVVDADPKSINDKTYCFWSHANATIVNDLSPIISHHYQSIQVDQHPHQTITHQPYYYIRSLDFYNHTWQSIKDANILVIRDTVIHVVPEAKQYLVQTTKQTLQASYIFDSRVPKPASLKKHHIHLHQSFFGLHIQTPEPCFKPDAFNMMNFQVEQAGYTQFMYVLPFSETEALVELTRFGKDKINQEYATDILNTFILEHIGLYSVLEHESGCIPMTNFQHPHSTMERVLHTGSAANLIKPSTGYGFKKMHAFAESVATQLASNKNIPFNRLGLASKPRFAFFDTLLLIILLNWPHWGKRIFTTLFKRNKIQRIFTFLDEKSTLSEEVSLFASLPLFPFLRAVYTHTLNTLQPRYIVATLCCLLYTIIHFIHPSSANTLVNVFLALGFLWVGIPHGALDHLLLKQSKPSLLRFILKYVSIMLIYFLCWHYFSWLSLSVFILFSSFHFGESELEEMQRSVRNRASYIEAGLLGAAILMALIGSHANESIQVISSITSFPLSSLVSNKLVGIGLPLSALLSFLYLIFMGVSTKKTAYAGILFLLVLGLAMPLMLAFGLYFVCQHSLNAWRHLQTGLQLPSRRLYWKGLPYTLGAVAFLVLFFAVDMPRYFTMSAKMGLVFVFLACVSLPHFILMHLFYKTAK